MHNSKQVCNSSKVSNHHAIVPTHSVGKADTSESPIGEREILQLVARQLLCVVSDAHRYAETAITLDCGDYGFTAKGRTVMNVGWKAYQTQERADKALP